MFKRVPVSSWVQLRLPNGEIRDCIGIYCVSEVVFTENRRWDRLDAKSTRTITLPLADLWSVHHPGWAFSGPDSSASIDELRANHVQFKIRVGVFFDSELSKSVGCETEWHDF